MKTHKSTITIKGEVIPVTVEWQLINEQINIVSVKDDKGTEYIHNWIDRFRKEIKRSWK